MIQSYLISHLFLLLIFFRVFVCMETSLKNIHKKSKHRQTIPKLQTPKFLTEKGKSLKIQTASKKTGKYVFE